MTVSRILLALALVAKTAAECPNACSGHGTCGAFDECTCYPNWEGGDCSLKTCPFALSHVDSPKGDLDGSADALSGTDTTVLVGSTVYPYGTTEQYPLIVDSRGYELINTAHAYAECGNKGICDRKTGECECFDGAEGAACQRASCPDPACSGHGSCVSASMLAMKDNANLYALWDKDVTMGCVCEPGYTGPSCEDKMCKYGVDPLYDDDEYMSVRVPTARVIISNTNADAGPNGVLAGTYAIKFYDVFGEDYVTTPITVNASCPDIQTALYELPNTVIPWGSVTCETQMETEMDAIQYDLSFQENPGDLKPIEIDYHLDGSRPTIYNKRLPVGGTDDTNKTVDFNVSVTVYPNFYGISGEFTDYFSQYCSGVAVTLSALPSQRLLEQTAGVRGIVGGLSTSEAKLLKKCLGDANGDTTDNVDVYDWDFGTWNTTLTPHIVKLAPHPTAGTEPKADVYDAGKYYLLWYDGTDGTTGSFYTGNYPEVVSGKEYAVFTTEGVATVVTNSTRTLDKPTMTQQFNFQNAMPVTGRWTKGTNVIYTSRDASCYHSMIATCLEKGDYIFLFEANWPDVISNPQHSGMSTGQVTAAENSGNMYKIVKIGINQPSATTGTTEDRYYIVVDKVINWDGSKTVISDTLGLLPVHAPMIGFQWIIKFEPSMTARDGSTCDGPGNYEYVRECSGRGMCDRDSGLCECFSGYTNDNCDLQSSLAV